jgi:hypothetical protein
VAKQSDLKLRSGHVIDAKILQACQKEKLKEFYEDWKKLCEERGYKPWNIVNVDEVGLAVDSSFHGKVVTAKLAALKEVEDEEERDEELERKINAIQEERMKQVYIALKQRLHLADEEEASTNAEAEASEEAEMGELASEQEEEEEGDDQDELEQAHDGPSPTPDPQISSATPTGAASTADQAWLRSVVLAPQRRSVVTLTLAANAEGWALPACLIHHGKTIPAEYLRIDDSVCKIVLNPETAWQTKATFDWYSKTWIYRPSIYRQWIYRHFFATTDFFVDFSLKCEWIYRHFFRACIHLPSLFWDFIRGESGGPGSDQIMGSDFLKKLVQTTPKRSDIACP